MKSRKPAVRYKIHLSDSERRKLQEILRGGRCWVWTAKRAQVLLHMDQGKNCLQAAEAVGVAENTVRRIAKRYLARGFDFALSDDERPGGKPLLGERQSHEIIAMVCGPPPRGMARWSIRLIAREAMSRGIVAKVDKETIRVLLGSHELKPWREKNVGDPGSDARVQGPDGGCSGTLPEAA
jgi:transposase